MFFISPYFPQNKQGLETKVIIINLPRYDIQLQKKIQKKKKQCLEQPTKPQPND